ncbi:MAG: hypothetical protein KDH19_20815 [Geminicoccaceae bacterium]|nr:hypothetical protein [Geminicoccaceae bacterium]
MTGRGAQGVFMLLVALGSVIVGASLVLALSIWRAPRTLPPISIEYFDYVDRDAGPASPMLLRGVKHYSCIKVAISWGWLREADQGAARRYEAVVSMQPLPNLPAGGFERVMSFDPPATLDPGVIRLVGELAYGGDDCPATPPVPLGGPWISWNGAAETADTDR